MIAISDSWIVRFPVPASALRTVADRLSECLDAAETTVSQVERTANAWEIELGFATPPDLAAIRQLLTDITPAHIAGELTVEKVAARDWVAASLAGLKPVHAGRFVVHGSHDRARRPAGIGIEIDAALAFGTGHHGTTRGCLLALDRVLKARRPHRILDVGTGTGVLAIGLAKALRHRITASEIDSQAVRVARANAGANGVGPLLRVIHSGTLASPAIGRGYDLVVANILLRPLQLMAAALAARVQPGGTVVLSGLLQAQAAAALAAYRERHLFLTARIDLDGWSTLILRRGTHRPSRPE